MQKLKLQIIIKVIPKYTKTFITLCLYSHLRAETIERVRSLILGIDK